MQVPGPTAQLGKCRFASRNWTGMMVKAADEQEGLGSMMTAPKRMEDVLSAVGSIYGLERAELLSHARTRRLHRPRQIAMYLSRLMSGVAPDEIGAVFGGRDETVIGMHCRAIARLCQEDRELARSVQSIETEVRRRWCLP